MHKCLGRALQDTTENLVVEYSKRIPKILKSWSILKVAWSYFLKISFVFHLKDHHTRDVNLKFQLNWSNRFDLVK